MATCGNRMKGRAYRQRHGSTGHLERGVQSMRAEAAS